MWRTAFRTQITGAGLQRSGWSAWKWGHLTETYTGLITQVDIHKEKSSCYVFSVQCNLYEIFTHIHISNTLRLVEIVQVTTYLIYIFRQAYIEWRAHTCPLRNMHAMHTDTYTHLARGSDLESKGHKLPVASPGFDPRRLMNQSSASWWRHQMEPFSALLALCAGNSPHYCQ